ncbi:MAG TPA: polymer-forming cytoskeletal protein [Gammaproteobacteria bacterium]|nr:polymer-forming cytoskeletal protein [Gammaproteobacteria bacterium]
MDTLIGEHTKIEGNVIFNGGLHIDGHVQGNVMTKPAADSVLSLSEVGVIEGEVHVANVVVNGTITGDVHALQKIELGPKARVTGNVYYKLIEMAMGAEVNGNLVHNAETKSQVVSLKDEKKDKSKSA